MFENNQGDRPRPDDKSGTTSPHPTFTDDLFSTLTPAHYEVFINHLIAHPMRFLEIQLFRQWLATERFRKAKATNRVKKASIEPEHAAHNTLDYNLAALDESVEVERPALLIKPLVCIEKVWRNISNLDLLSVGPRSEIEIFFLFTQGFRPERIRALDLFSYSPFVDVGDMHAMPYPDDSFDVAILGWVIPYSKEPQRVADELIRCCRSGSFIGISADYSSPDSPDSKFAHESSHFQSSDEILSLFGDRVKHVYFRQDPDLPAAHASIAIFELK